MISVVIPTYNDAHFLPTALTSCLNQTIPLEIVLVDDGSSVPLPEEVHRFIEQHRNIVTYVRHGWNCGLSAARNTGIAHARFDLIVPLDADDWFLDGALAPLVSVLTEDVDVAYGNVLDSGTLYEPVTRPLQRTDFLEDNPLFCSSVFRKHVWQTVGGYTVRAGPHYEDWNFWAKAFKAGFRFRYAPVTVYEHRTRADSMLQHLHHERARFVRIATEPLREPEPCETKIASLEPTTAGRLAELIELIDPSLRNERVDLVLRTLEASIDGVAAARGLDVDELRGSVARFLEHGARGLTNGERKSDLLLSHARIGQLMIELERAKQATASRETRRAPELVLAHATIGRLLLERQPAIAVDPKALHPAQHRPRASEMS